MSRSGSVRLIIAAIFVVALATTSSPAEAADCTRKVNDVKSPGPALKEPIVLTAAEGSQQRLTNFDDERGTKDIRDIRINSDKRLPDSLTPSQINFEALIQRSSETLETVDFPDPTFTDPRILAGRKRLSFTICLNADGVDAGKYVGSVTVSGPEGLGEASVGITANLKAGLYLWFGLTVVAILISLGALWWKARNDGTPKNGAWWFKTVFAMGTAFGALSAAYFNDSAWGADPLTAGLALIGTAFASIGGRRLLE